MTDIKTNSDFITATVDAEHLDEIKKYLEKSNEMVGYVVNDGDETITCILDISVFPIKLR